MSNAKIVSLEARIAKLQAELVVAVEAAGKQVDLSTLAGKQYGYNYGRGEAKVQKIGNILGVSLPEGKGAPIVRILTGTGASSQIDSVFVSALIAEVTAE